MKKILNIVFLFLCFQSSAQNIVAGEYDANEYYYDFVPDHILYAPESINSSTDSIYIDLNNDGIDDVIIDVHNLDGGNWLNKKHAEIIPLANCEVSFGTIDTCFANCPPPDYVSFEAITNAYDSLDLIDSTGVWIDSSSYLAFTRWEATVPNGCGYGCGGGNFGSGYRYAGVRIFPAGDTLYGWIKLRVFATNPGDFDLAIDAFACNTYVVGLKELSQSNKEIIRIVDILGRETENKPNTLLIYVFSDGTTEKVYRVE